MNLEGIIRIGCRRRAADRDWRDASAVITVTVAAVVVIAIIAVMMTVTIAVAVTPAIVIMVTMAVAAGEQHDSGDQRKTGKAWHGDGNP